MRVVNEDGPKPVDYAKPPDPQRMTREDLWREVLWGVPMGGVFLMSLIALFHLLGWA
jgi:hypothetical protein